MNNYDEVLGKLREARALLRDEKEAGQNSDELSICLIKVGTAILWRQEDLRLKNPGEDLIAGPEDLLFILGKLYTNGRVIVKCPRTRVDEYFFSGIVVAKEEHAVLNVGEESPYFAKRHFIEFKGDPNTYEWPDLKAGQTIKDI